MFCGNAAAFPSEREALAELIDLHRTQTPAPPFPVLPGGVTLADATRPADDCPPLLRHTYSRLQGGAPESLCQFKGKVLLVVNTASYCGYTRQYEGLEALYRKYQDRGLVVVGFPSNDFNQEPGTNKEVAEFCRTTYGVQFPMFEKGGVTALSASPFYAELAKRSGQAPRWNFHKYVRRPQWRPGDELRQRDRAGPKELVALIERLLAAKPPATRADGRHFFPVIGGTAAFAFNRSGITVPIPQERLMNAPERFFLPDTQSQPDPRRLPIQKVGVKGLRYPLALAPRRRRAATVAKLAMTVGLPPEVKGTHMSRFVEVLEARAAR